MTKKSIKEINKAIREISNSHYYCASSNTISVKKYDDRLVDFDYNFCLKICDNTFGDKHLFFKFDDRIVLVLSDLSGEIYSRVNVYKYVIINLKDGDLIGIPSVHDGIYPLFNPYDDEQNRTNIKLKEIYDNWKLDKEIEKALK